MSEKTVNTVCGPFNRTRYDQLCATLDAAEKEGMDRDDVVKFEGQDLVISFGGFLRQFLDQTFAQRGHGAL